MSDREKVLKGLEFCLEDGCKGEECPYHCYNNCATVLRRDSFELLKKQEPVIPKEERLNDVDSIYRCGNCGTHFYYRQQKYCAICGRKAKWDG